MQLKGFLPVLGALVTMPALILALKDSPTPPVHWEPVPNFNKAPFQPTGEVVHQGYNAHPTDSVVPKVHWPQPHRRAVPDTDWNQLVCKGEKLLHYMTISAEEVNKLQGGQDTQSKWVFDDLTKYGWDEGPITTELDFPIRLPIKKAMDYAGIPQDDKAFYKTQWFQYRDFTQDGKTYPATHGQYYNYYVPAYHAIMCVDNTSPRAAIQQRDPHGVWPKLSRWSDVSYLAYMHSPQDLVLPSTAAPAPPRYIFRLGIKNQVTLDVIDEIWMEGLDSLPAWPGITVPMDSQEGQALLATPNGVGVAWMLVGWKEAFAGLVVTKATVFQDDKGMGNVNVLFEIGEPEAGMLLPTQA